MPDGSSAPDWYQIWGVLLSTIRRVASRGTCGYRNLQFDPGFPTSIFTNDTLVREPRKLGFWK